MGLSQKVVEAELDGVRGDTGGLGPVSAQALAASGGRDGPLSPGHLFELGY